MRSSFGARVQLLPSLLALAALAVIGLTTGTLAQSCPASRTYDAVPANPGFSTAARSTIAALSLSSFVRLGCSEKVSIYTQTTPYTGDLSTIPGIALPAVSFADNKWPLTNCPHARTDLTPFETEFPTINNGDTITVLTGKKLLLRACMLPAAMSSDSFVLYRLIVQAGAVLVLDDAPLTLRVREIQVAAGGSILGGSETCRLFSRINIIFAGSGSDSQRPSDSTTTALPSKGLMNNGVFDLHGKEYFPTWTRLARLSGGSAADTAGTILDSIIFLQEAVNWEVGQQIVVTTTILLDCNDEQGAQEWCQPCYEWQDYTAPECAPVKQQNEVRTIIALGQSPVLPSGSRTLFSALQLDSPLIYQHYAGIEYQAEVALISRRIQVSGTQTNDNYGAHMMSIGSVAEGRFSGVSCTNCGQLNELGRYPFHMHLMGDTTGSSKSFVTDCLVLHSNFRAYTIHGSNHTRFSRNVGFNITGMGFYLEDGVEENNMIEYNLLAHVSPIYRPANGEYTQIGDNWVAIPGQLLIPADVSAAPFYALNSHNAWVGNTASGGWSGFVFPNAPGAMGDYKPADDYYADAAGLNMDPWRPMNRPLLKFIGNTAHSSGYYWWEHGSCMYVGAWLDYSGPGGIMAYDSGRTNRNSHNPDGTVAIDIFTDTKTWMCNKGIAHWGENALIQNAEFHDVRIGAMVFGEAAIINALINRATPNRLSNYRLEIRPMGFQFYDTYVKTILSGVTLRNYHTAMYDPSMGTQTVYAIRYMDQSDHYTPQGINAVRGITYDNVDTAARLGIDHCGLNCPVEGDTQSTMSSRIYSVWDWDGTLTGTSYPAITGSTMSWWNNDNGCTFRTDLVPNIWVCPWYERSTVVFFGPYVPRMGSGTCDTTLPGGDQCTDQYSPFLVGYMSQWGGTTGQQRQIKINQWPGVAGHSNTGWYWRPQSTDYGVDGAPSLFYIGETMQIPRNNFVVLAVAYPASAVLKVSVQNLWWGMPDWVLTESTYALVTQSTETLNDPSAFTGCSTDWWGYCTGTGGVGPAYVVTGGFLYLRVVSPACYNNNQASACVADETEYAAGGLSIPQLFQGFTYKVEVTSCSGCTVVGTVDSNSADGVITFYSATDMPPAGRFTTDYGNVRAVVAKPTDPATGEDVTEPTCSAASTTIYDPNQALDPVVAGTPADADPTTGLPIDDPPAGTNPSSGTNPPSSDAKAKPAVSLTFKMEREVSELTEGWRRNFTAILSTAVNISNSRVSVTSVVPGSAVVTFRILPTTDAEEANGEPSATDAATALLAKWSSLVVAYSNISGSADGSNIMAGADATSVPESETQYECTDGSWASDCSTEVSKGNKSSGMSMPVGILIAIIVGVVAGLAMIVAAVVYCRRRNSSRSTLKQLSIYGGGSSTAGGNAFEMNPVHK